MVENPENLEYGRYEKFGAYVGTFGRTSFEPKKRLSETQGDPWDKVLQQTLRLAWTHGCPRPLYCIGTYGLEYMSKRYFTCNQTSQHLLFLTEDTNPHLYSELVNFTPRLNNEPVGIHEPTSVPKFHLKKITPGAGIHGYALPRLILLSEEKGWEIFGSIMPEAENANQLMVKIARELGELPSLERENILSHLLSGGVLKEENCYSAFDKLAQALMTEAPNLVKTYEELTSSQRTVLDIATIPILGPKI